MRKRIFLKWLIGGLILAWIGYSLYALSATNIDFSDDNGSSIFLLLFVCLGAFFGILAAGGLVLNLLKKVEDRWVE